jgi:hypothetical protein
MHPDLWRKTICAAAVVLPLMSISCNRQSVGQKQPAVEEQNAGAARVGTTGTTAPAQPEAGTSSTATASDAATERDADAIKALEDMSNYLRTLKAIQVHATTSRDEVLVDGQNVTFSGTLDMIAERPNHLRAEVINDKQQRMYFDDGKTFSVWARRVNYYATIPAPPTLRELAEKLSDEYNVELPLADLFYWGDSKTTGRHRRRHRPRPCAGRRNDVRTLCVPAEGRRLAGLDTTGQLPAATEAGDHDDLPTRRDRGTHR